MKITPTSPRSDRPARFVRPARPALFFGAVVLGLAGFLLPAVDP